MPPQPPFSASGIRGYVCRSCISKVQNSRHPRPSWLTRNATSHSKASRAKASRARTKVPNIQQPKSGSVINYWEQDAEGNIRKNPFQDREFLEKMQGAMLDEDFDPESLLEAMGEEGMREDEGEEEEQIYDEIERDLIEQVENSMPWSSEEQSKMAALEAQVNAMDNEVQRILDIPNLENISEDERLKIRRELLSGVAGIDIDEEPSSVGYKQTSSVADVQNAPEQIETPPVQYTHLPSTDVTDLTDQNEALPTQRASSTREAQDLRISTSIRVDPLNAEEFPEAHRNSIRRLNTTLQLCSRGLEENKLSDVAQRNAWETFLLCRKYLFEAPEKVPIETWSLLWNVFEHPGVKNFGRMEHIYLLGKSMRKHEIPFLPMQHVLYMESKFIRGHREKALREWEAAEQSLGRNKVSLKNYWELGVRMYAENGDGEKALDAVASYFSECEQNADFRLLIPVIRGFLLMGTEHSQNRAWRVYEALRSNLGSEITMEDFDNVTALFLDADLPNRALDVFKDLMLSGEKPRRSSIAQDLVNGRSLVQKVRTGLDLEDSQTLAALPPHLNNKFFFGKWIKKLIGEGHLDAAQKVLDLMSMRGIRPDSRYMNGLIGAFYRNGPSGKQQLAEDLAWKMIASRLEFVKARDTTYQLEGPIQVSKSSGKLSYKNPLSLEPLATIETFSILIEQYRRRQKQDIIPDLLDTLHRAKIPPNTGFMNQLIMANVKYRSGQGAWAWDTYTSLVRRQNVHPDFNTFTYLWDLMRRASDPVTKSQGRGFITHRRLFLEMVNNAGVLCRGGLLPREVYDMTILSFSLCNDQAGTAVALRALHRHFDLFPSEVTIRTIVHQLAKVGLLDQQGRSAKRLEPKKVRIQNRVIQVTKILATFQQRRAQDLLEQGLVFEKLTDEEKLEQSLVVLADLLRFVAHERLQAGAYKGVYDTTADLSKEAAAEMGVPDSDPWDVIEGRD